MPWQSMEAFWPSGSPLVPLHRDFDGLPQYGGAVRHLAFLEHNKLARRLGDQAVTDTLNWLNSLRASEIPGRVHLVLPDISGDNFDIDGRMRQTDQIAVQYERRNQPPSRLLALSW